MAKKKEFKVGDVYLIRGVPEVIEKVTAERIETDCRRYFFDPSSIQGHVNELDTKIDGITIEGTDYPIGFVKGKMIVGCQTIPRKGQLQLFRKLADKLGYDLDE